MKISQTWIEPFNWQHVDCKAMDNTSFSTQTIKAIMFSQEEARRHGHPCVDTEHLLLGILSVKSIAADEIRKLGINLKRARREVYDLVARGQGFTAINCPFSDSSKSILEMAWQEAKSLGHEKVTPEHVLLGLLKLENNVGTAALERMDVSLSKLYRCVYVAIGGSEPALTDDG